MIDICICTHNPDWGKLELVLKALTTQTSGPDSFEVTVVDNASDDRQRLEDLVRSVLDPAGIKTTVLRELRLGVAHARVMGMREAKHAALLFVDDDNVLDSHFVEETQKILAKYEDVGVFSGKMMLPDQAEVPEWTKPLWGSLAIKDCGDTPITGWYLGDWAAWIPVATASMVVRRVVIDHFLEKYGTQEGFGNLGRKGKNDLMSLMSGEDTIIAMSAGDVDLKCGYFPSLRMHHHVSPERFRFFYLARLYFLMGISEFRQNSITGKVPIPLTWTHLRNHFVWLGGPDAALRVKACYFLFFSTGTLGTIRLLQKHRLPIFARGELFFK